MVAMIDVSNRAPLRLPAKYRRRRRATLSGMSASAPITRFQLAEIGALLADPARAGILLALLDGSSRPATELALLAGVAPATASAHLRALVDGGLLVVLPQGRHRYFRIAGDDIAHLLETLAYARSSPRQARRAARDDPALARARSCYRHLAGRLGVALFERLNARGGLAIDSASVRLERPGLALLRDAGLLAAGDVAERLQGRTCLDWTERRFHLGGPLGSHLLQRLLDLRWLRRADDARALELGARGRTGLRALGIDWNRLAA